MIGNVRLWIGGHRFRAWFKRVEDADNLYFAVDYREKPRRRAFVWRFWGDGTATVYMWGMRRNAIRVVHFPRVELTAADILFPGG